MKEIKGDIWEEVEKNDGIILIPVNHFIKKNGEAVMGRGLALQAKTKYPDLPKIWGDAIKQCGALVHYCRKHNVILFQVKKSWFDKADLSLINRGLAGFKFQLTEGLYDKTVFMPHIGCGNGGLLWSDVKPLIEKHLSGLNVVICDIES